MANGATVYNLEHVQVAIIQTTPVWVDLPYAQTFDPTITQDSEDLQADGKQAVTAYGPPTGEGTVEWARAEPVTLALLAGLTATSSGTTPATIDRLVYKGDTTPPGLHWSAWARNVDANITGAGMRVTLPNAKASVPAMPLGQETFSTLSSDLRFTANAANDMMILEFMETAPAYTSGVIPVNLTAPA